MAGVAAILYPVRHVQCSLPDDRYMNYSPRVLNAMLTAGRYDDVRSRAIWACTGCYACTVECPKQRPVTGRSTHRSGRRRARAPTARSITPVLARQSSASSTSGGGARGVDSLALYLRTRPFQRCGMRRGAAPDGGGQAAAAPEWVRDPDSYGGSSRPSTRRLGRTHEPRRLSRTLGEGDRPCPPGVAACRLRGAGPACMNCRTGAAAALGVPRRHAAKAAALSARNLALAEGVRPGPDPVDVLAPCAGCDRATPRPSARSPTAGRWPSRRGRAGRGRAAV